MSSYNHASFIMESIESVRRQTYKNWELIIVDDGSDDSTAEVVSGITDERIQFYNPGRLGNGSKIKNIGLGIASGELIAFIDSDDLWSETKLEKQVAALREFPEAGFSLTGGYNFRNASEPVEYFYGQKEGMRYDNIFLSCFKSEVAGFTQALMVRKDCLDATGIFNEDDSFSDMEFILSLARRFKAVILYELLFFRRLHGTNYSSEQQISWHYKGLEMIRHYKSELPYKVFAQSLFLSHINLGEKFLKQKKSVNAMLQFCKAWAYKPFSSIPLKKLAKAILAVFKK